MFLLIPSSPKSKVLVAVSMFSMMKFSSNLRFSARCDTVVAVPTFSLYGLGGQVPKPV